MLIELLVATTMLTVVLGAVLVVLEQTTRSAGEDQERARSVRTAEVELEAMVREARHAYRIHPSTATRLDADVHMGNRTRRVIFDCGVAHPTLANTRRCMRQENVGGALTAPQVVVDRVRNTSVFAYTLDGPAISYVAVSVEVPASGEMPSNGYAHTIRLNDGFEVKNRGIVP